MVRFERVDPKDFPNLKEGRRGRVSYPILKTFLETNEVLVKLDRQGIQQSLQSLTSCLTSYCRNHNLPIKILTRGGELYLMRTDTDDEGNLLNENLQIGPRSEPVAVIDTLGDAEDVLEIDDAEVERRYNQEKHEALK